MAVLSTEQKREHLGNVSLFSELEPKAIDALARVARTVSLEKRQQLFHKGDAGSTVYVVASGKLKALTTSDEGDDVVFSILGGGEVLGEVALLGGSPRTATVTAIEPAELIMLDRRDFLAFLKSHPEVSIKLLEVLAQRVMRISEFVEDTLFLNLPLRLAKKMLDLARLYGEQTDAGIRLDLKLSQEEWGDLVGATRESINKPVRAWVEEGIVELDRGYFVIKKKDELEKLAGAIVY